MKCANHPDSDATALCSGCQRALCSDCHCGDGAVFCSPCVIAHNNAVTRYFFKQLAISGLLLVSSLYFLSKSAMAWETIILLALMATFLPFWLECVEPVFPAGPSLLSPGRTIHGALDPPLCRSSLGLACGAVADLQSDPRNHQSTFG